MWETQLEFHIPALALTAIAVWEFVEWTTPRFFLSVSTFQANDNKHWKVFWNGYYAFVERKYINIYLLKI